MKFPAMEEELSTKERNELPDSAFGLPNDRKYPLTDAAHVRSAISYFYKCPEKKKPQLATRIEKAAKEFSVDIGENAEIQKYLVKISNEAIESLLSTMEEYIDFSNHIDTVVESSMMKRYVDCVEETTRLVCQNICKQISDIYDHMNRSIHSISGIYAKNPKVILSRAFDEYLTAISLTESAMQTIVQMMHRIDPKCENPTDGHLWIDTIFSLMDLDDAIADTSLKENLNMIVGKIASLSNYSIESLAQLSDQVLSKYEFDEKIRRAMQTLRSDHYIVSIYNICDHMSEVYGDAKLPHWSLELKNRTELNCKVKLIADTLHWIKKCLGILQTSIVKISNKVLLVGNA